MRNWMPEGGWQLNVGDFMRYYRPRGWGLSGAPGGFGWMARCLAGPRPRRTLKARTLDGLAELIEAHR
jgi:hypothetical protein